MSISYETGIASEYLVLSNLYRLGLDAYMSLGNKKSVDLAVTKKDDSVITIDVKAVQGYSSLIVNNVSSKPNHYIVFVVYNNKFRDINILPEFFVVPSVDIESLQKVFKTEKRIYKSDIVKYKNNWNILMS